MPQMQFWATRIPCKIQWSYQIDPARPDRDPLIEVQVLDQGHKITEWYAHQLDVPLVHEAVDGWLSETWAAYLFGEPGAIRDASTSAVRRWRDYCASNPIARP